MRRQHFLEALLLLVLLVSAARCKRRTTFEGLPPETIFNRDYVATVQTLNFVTDPGHFLAEWYQCPVGTEYAVRTPRLPTAISFDSPILRHQAIGCCPANSVPCTVPNVDRVLGCCPVGTFCTYQQHHDYFGVPLFAQCAPSYYQDCYGTVCGEGYTCCPTGDDRTSVCVPHAGDPSDREAVCGEVFSYTPHLSLKRSGFTRTELAFKPPGQRFSDDDADIQIIVQGQGHTVIADFTLVPPQYKTRRGGNRCHITDHADEFIVPYKINATTGAVVSNRTLLGGCCLPGLEHCSLPDRTFIGCVNATLGETCCGASICPGGVGDQKCCFFPASETASGTDEHLCCPSALTCCYGDPSRIASLGAYPPPGTFNKTLTSRPYCGMAVEGLECAMDRMAPASWFLLTARRGNT